MCTFVGLWSTSTDSSWHLSKNTVIRTPALKFLVQAPLFRCFKFENGCHAKDVGGRMYLGTFVFGHHGCLTINAYQLRGAKTNVTITIRRSVVFLQSK